MPLKQHGARHLGRYGISSRSTAQYASPLLLTLSEVLRRAQAEGEFKVNMKSSSSSKVTETVDDGSSTLRAEQQAAVFDKLVQDTRAIVSLKDVLDFLELPEDIPGNSGEAGKSEGQGAAEGKDSDSDSTASVELVGAWDDGSSLLGSFGGARLDPVSAKPAPQQRSTAPKAGKQVGTAKGKANAGDGKPQKRAAERESSTPKKPKLDSSDGAPVASPTATTDSARKRGRPALADLVSTDQLLEQVGFANLKTKVENAMELFSEDVFDLTGEEKDFKKKCAAGSKEFASLLKALGAHNSCRVASCAHNSRHPAPSAHNSCHLALSAHRSLHTAPSTHDSI